MRDPDELVRAGAKALHDAMYALWWRLSVGLFLLFICDGIVFAVLQNDGTWVVDGIENAVVGFGAFVLAPFVVMAACFLTALAWYVAIGLWVWVISIEQWADEWSVLAIVIVPVMLFAGVVYAGASWCVAIDTAFGAVFADEGKRAPA